MTDLNQNRKERSPDDAEFSVIIPVYNSENALEPLVERIDKVFKNLNRSYEIVLTDDGSRDRSWKVIESLHSRGFPIRAFNFMKNHGQHFALKCGIDNCVGDYAITMDDDLQHPPEEIPKLIQAIEEDPDVDVVIGRYESKKHSFLRNMGTLAHERIQCVIFKKDPNLRLSSFRIIRRVVIDEIRKVRHSKPWIGLMILSITSKIKNVEVKHEKRAIGRSGYTFCRMIAVTLSNMISYSSLPLRAISYIGIGSSLLSLLLAMIYLLKYFLGQVKVSGFMSIILAILFTSGLIMFSFGLVGEYLSRIVSQQLMHAQYSVRSRLVPGERQKKNQESG